MSERILTSEDVAKSLDRAALRVLRILMDVRQQEGLFEPVKGSRFLRPGTLELLAGELATWGVSPMVTTWGGDAERSSGGPDG